MKAIKFTDSELDFLKAHYELELSEVENYVAEIKNILKKFGVTNTVTAKEKPATSSGKKRGRPKKENTVPAMENIPATESPVKKSALKKKKKKAGKKRSIRSLPVVSKPAPAAGTAAEGLTSPE
ncbi:MAG: hypothetical protein WCO44_04425 [Bacteroidota bacterium]